MLRITGCDPLSVAVLYPYTSGKTEFCTRFSLIQWHPRSPYPRILLFDNHTETPLWRSDTLVCNQAMYDLTCVRCCDSDKVGTVFWIFHCQQTTIQRQKEVFRIKTLNVSKIKQTNSTIHYRLIKYIFISVQSRLCCYNHPHCLMEWCL